MRDNPVQLQVGFVSEEEGLRLVFTRPPHDWPTASSFQVTLKETESFGYQLHFTGLPTADVRWAWWDFVDADLRERHTSDGGPIAEDDEQGFVLRMREVRGYVYVAVGTKFTDFHTWFRVPTDRYHRAWTKAIEFARERGNAFRSVPEALRHRERARFLYLWNQDLYELPPEIGSLTGLIGLNVGMNRRLTELPESVTELTALRWIDARLSQLRVLPRRLDRLTALTSLNVTGTALPPDELDRARQILGVSVVTPPA